MTTQVETGITGITAYGANNRCAFINSRGLKDYYIFYRDTDVNGDHSVHYEYSTGASFTGKTIVIDFGNVATNNGWCHDFDVIWAEDSANSQTEVWVVAIGYDGDAAAWQSKYVRGTIADASSTISWGTVQTIDAALSANLAGTPANDPYCISLERTDNGRIVVCFTEDTTNKGKDYRVPKCIGSDGDGASPSWSGETTIWDPTGNNAHQDMWKIFYSLDHYSSTYGDRIAGFMNRQDANAGGNHELAGFYIDWDGSTMTVDPPDTIVTNSVAGAWYKFSAVIDDEDILRGFYVIQATSTPNLYYLRAFTAGDSGNVLRFDTGLSPTTNFDALLCFLDDGPSSDVPTSDEASGSWTASSGSDLYAMVDEGFPETTSDYISTTTNNDVVRLGGFSGGITHVIVTSEVSTQGSVTMTVDTYKSGVLVENLVTNVTLENPAVGTGVSYCYWTTDHDWNEIRIAVSGLTTETVQIFSVYAGGPRLYGYAHDASDTVDAQYLYVASAFIQWSDSVSPEAVTGRFEASDTYDHSFHFDVQALSSSRHVVENQICMAMLQSNNLYWNIIPTHTALSTTLADLEFPDQNYYLGPHST
jgi:hypothetical protein